MTLLIAFLGFPFRLVFALVQILVGCFVLCVHPSAWEEDGGWKAFGELWWWVLTSQPEGFFD